MAKRETPAPELLATFRPESAKPEDVEALIDLRVAQIDEQITPHLAAVEELQTERKRWLTISGGRSRINRGEAKPEEVAPCTKPNGRA